LLPARLSRGGVLFPAALRSGPRQFLRGRAQIRLAVEGHFLYFYATHGKTERIFRPEFRVERLRLYEHKSLPVLSAACHQHVKNRGTKMPYSNPRLASIARTSAVILLLAGIGLIPSPACAQSLGPTGATRTLVAGVRVSGNETTKASYIHSQLKTRVDREFDPKVVQADVRRLASTGKFKDVRTYTQNSPEGVLVTFEVFERPTVRYIRYLGNRNISDKMLMKQVGLEVGDSLNRYAVEEAARKLEDFYRSKGFSETQVSILEGDEQQDRGAVFLINEGTLERISSVDFVGNTIVSDSRLKTLIKSKPGFLWYLFRGKVDRKQIDEDIQRLTAYYRGLGYFNARVGRELEFGDSGEWLDITFVIDEGPRYVVRNVSVVGNTKFDNQALLERLNLHSGDYFDLGKLNRDTMTLRDIYGGEGHFFADIEADPRFLEEPGQLDLVYNVEEGAVWHAGKINIHIKGEHPHTRESVVLNRLSIRPGDKINTREVRSSERRLKSCQLFLNDPTTGSIPEVRIRPPELQDYGNFAGLGDDGGTSYRAQSPSGY
jgi:outer membrane protein insertion porin family